MEHHHAKKSNLSNFEEREKVLPSQKILEDFGIRQGMHLADLGCGYGFFSIRAAEMVGPEGLIEAVDIDEERLAELQRRAEARGVRSRILTYKVTEERVPLPDASVEIALIANVLHELNDPISYLKEVGRILQSKGQVWIVEWQKKETPMGPPLHERCSTQEWIEILREAGFQEFWSHDLEPAHVLIKGNYLPKGQ